MTKNIKLFDKKCAAIIVAGGNGTRMKSTIPKQFLLLKDKTILEYTIEHFINIIPSIQIIVVLPNEHLGLGEKICQKINSSIKIVSGGTTRYESVQQGVKALSDEEIVFVHDAVRPLITRKLLTDCYTTALQLGNAIPCIPITDSVRQINDHTSKPIDRSTLRSVQTPQTFQASILKKITSQMPHSTFTDEATVAENVGYTIRLVDGDKRNIKITTPEDLILAEAYLKYF